MYNLIGDFDFWLALLLSGFQPKKCFLLESNYQRIQLIIKRMCYQSKENGTQRKMNTKNGPFVYVFCQVINNKLHFDIGLILSSG